MNYVNCNKEDLEKEYAALVAEYEEVKGKGLKLNMARGKPGEDQLNLSRPLLDVINSSTDCITAHGADCRNYGELAGIDECKNFFAEIFDVDPSDVMVGGNSSLNMMFDTIAGFMTKPVVEGCKPWYEVKNRKFLCPAPGYDRHFAITEYFDFDLIPVPMTENGPDMDVVEKLVENDDSIKGIWCVPKYSNPDGTIYSAETIRRLAALRPAAADFTIMWDNAYCVHEFDGPYVPFPDIISLCREAGNPDMVFEFASTSKITLPGAGISVMASSEANIQYMQGLLAVQTISYDKMNQLRHVRYLQDKAHTLELMARHGQILRPKFEMVLNMLEQELAPRGLGHWQRPKGGYFVSYYALEGTAKRALELCRQTGVVMTGAGATYPYGIDPRDSNIRIAPSFPPVEELEQAMKIFCLCIRQAALEKLQNS